MRNGPVLDMLAIVDRWTNVLVALNPLILTSIALAGACILTTAGSLPAICWNVPKMVRSLFYACMAGTMVASATVGMIPQSLQRAEQTHWSEPLPWIPTVVGMACGLVLLQFVALAVAFIHERRKRKHPSGGDTNGTYVELTTSQTNGTRKGATVRFKEDDLEGDGVELLAQQARVDTEQRLIPASTAAIETVMPRGNEESKHTAVMRRTIMMVSALVLQQLPEGIMLGVSFANVHSAPPDERARALRVALSGTIAVWLGSLPEGLAMMIPLRKAHVHPLRGLIFVQVSMLMQIVAGLAGCVLVSFVQSLLPFALGAVASAVIFTAFSEIIPAAYKTGARWLVNIIIMGGFMLMVVLINLFG